MSSLRRGHANLLCIVPSLTDAPEGVRNYTPQFWYIYPCFEGWHTRLRRAAPHIQSIAHSSATPVHERRGHGLQAPASAAALQAEDLRHLPFGAHRLRRLAARTRKLHTVCAGEGYLRSWTVIAGCHGDSHSRAAARRMGRRRPFDTRTYGVQQILRSNSICLVSCHCTPLLPSLAGTAAACRRRHCRRCLHPC